MNYKVGDIGYYILNGHITQFEVTSCDPRYYYLPYIGQVGEFSIWLERGFILPKIKNNKLNQKLYKNKIYKEEDGWLIIKNS